MRKPGCGRSPARNSHSGSLSGGLKNDIFSDCEAIIGEVTREAVAREIKVQMHWRDSMAVRNLSYTAQTCMLATNLVHLLLDTEPQTRDAIMETSEDGAKKALKKFYPYIAGLLDELRKTESAQEKGE
jgi:hypothetical protein